MACVVEGDRLYCTTADVSFGPRCASGEEAEMLRIWCYHVLGKDPRKVIREGGEDALRKALHDIRHPEELTEALQKQLADIKDEVKMLYGYGPY